MEVHYNYVVSAVIEDGKFVKWIINYDETDHLYPQGNRFHVRDQEYLLPVRNTDSNLIMNLGARLMDNESTPTTTTKDDGNLPPW